MSKGIFKGVSKWAELLLFFAYTQIANSVNEGRLVPEDIIFGLLTKRLEDGYNKGETGFILDGIPRTRMQAVSTLYFYAQTICDLVTSWYHVTSREDGTPNYFQNGVTGLISDLFITSHVSGDS